MKQVIFILMAMLMTISVASAQGDKQAVLSVKENIYDFGTIKEDGGNVSHTFVVSNEGASPLVMTRVIASCGCTTPQWTKEPIAPGKKGEVKVTFNPKGRPGMFAKTISIYSNGKKGSYILTIKGKVEN